MADAVEGDAQGRQGAMHRACQALQAVGLCQEVHDIAHLGDGNGRPCFRGWRVGCFRCGFCVDACPEEALIMSREYDLTTYTRDGETTYGIRNLTERPEIEAYGAGYRPHMQYPLVESYLPTQRRSEP